jgi:hypothetical protein
VKTFPWSISENERRKLSIFKREKISEIKLGLVAAQIFTEIKWNIHRLILEFFTNEKMLLGTVYSR